MNIRFERVRLPIEVGGQVEIPLDEFDGDDVRSLQFVVLPFDAEAIQLVTIAHVLSEEELAAQEMLLRQLNTDALESLEDDLDV